MLPKDLEPTFGNAQGKIFEIVRENKKAIQTHKRSEGW